MDQQPSAQPPVQPSAGANAVTGKLLGIGELLTKSWELYKRRLWTLVGIQLLPVVVVELLLLMTFFALRALPENSWALFVPLPLLLLVAVVIVNVWGQAAQIQAMANDGVGVTEAYRRTMSRLMTIVWVALLTASVVLGAALLLVVPGIIVGILVAFSLYIAVLEGGKGLDTLAKSREYVRGKWWAVFGRIVVFGIAYAIVSMILSAILGAFLPDTQTYDDIASSVIALFLTPFAVAFIYLLYRNLKQLSPAVPDHPTGSRTWYIVLAILGPFSLWVIFSIIVAAMGFMEL